MEEPVEYVITVLLMLILTFHLADTVTEIITVKDICHWRTSDSLL